MLWAQRPRAAQSRVKKILCLVVALILYGSLYPWRFHAAAAAQNPLWILLHSWPSHFARADARDAAINLALYLPFGVFQYFALRRLPAALRAFLTLVAAICLSASIEMIQLFVASRHCSLFDVHMNGVGAAFGIAAAATFPSSIEALVQGAETAGAFRLTGSVALLYLWVGYQLFPGLPAFSPSTVRLHLTNLAGSFSGKDFAENAGGWLAVSALLSRLAPHRIWAALALALLAIPAKLFIASRTMTLSELTGAVLGIGAWILIRNRTRPMLAAGLVAVAALVVAGLLPLAGATSPHPFHWIPFLPLLESPWESAFVILLRKGFLYGSGIWLLNENGRGWTQSSILIAIPLACIEAIQIYLPGRTPEITDPILALLLGGVLMLLERDSRERSSAVRRMP